MHTHYQGTVHAYRPSSESKALAVLPLVGMCRVCATSVQQHGYLCCATAHEFNLKRKLKPKPKRTRSCKQKRKRKLSCKLNLKGKLKLSVRTSEAVSLNSSMLSSSSSSNISPSAIWGGWWPSSAPACPSGQVCSIVSARAPALALNTGLLFAAAVPAAVPAEAEAPSEVPAARGLLTPASTSFARPEGLSGPAAAAAAKLLAAGLVGREPDGLRTAGMLRAARISFMCLLTSLPPAGQG